MFRNACLSLTVALAASSMASAQNQPVQREINREQRQLNQAERQLNREERQINRNANQADQQRVQTNDANELDNHIANCLLLHNQEEIELARLAAQHSQNQKVKDFAQTLIRDHEQFAQKLQKFASRDANSNREQNAPTVEQRQTSGVQARDERDLNRDGVIDAREAARSDAAPALLQPADANSTAQRGHQPGQRIEHRAGFRGGNALGDQLYQIERDAVSECERMTKECLNKEQGANWDKAFVGMQIGAHIGLLSHLNAAEQHVSGEFQQVLNEGAQTTQKHKDQAEQLKNELMNTSGNRNQAGQ